MPDHSLSKASRHTECVQEPEEGRAALRQWVESPTPLVFSYDEFFLKAYSLWLADPERIVERFREQAQLHQERLELYEQVPQSKQLAESAESEKADLFELNEAWS